MNDLAARVSAISDNWAEPLEKAKSGLPITITPENSDAIVSKMEDLSDQIHSFELLVDTVWVDD